MAHAMHACSVVLSLFGLLVLLMPAAAAGGPTGGAPRAHSSLMSTAVLDTLVAGSRDGAERAEGSTGALFADGLGMHILRRTLPVELQQHGRGRVMAAAAEAAASAPAAPTEDCPADIAAKIAAAGYLSVEWTGAIGTLPHLSSRLDASDGAQARALPHDDSPGVQRALELSKACGGTMVYFPGHVVYNFFSTVNITSQAVLLQGGQGRTRPGVGSVQGVMSASPTFIQASSIPMGGPAFFLNSSTTMIELQNFAIEASFTGIKVSNCAGIRLYKVGVIVNALPGSTVYPGCTVELGSNNTALVIENSFWIWIELSSFFMGPYPGVPSPTCPDPKNQSTCCQGQKPSVILRGGPTSSSCPPSVYLVSFRDVTFWGGGVQYQQTFCAANNYQNGSNGCDDPSTGKPNPALAGDLAPGWFEFLNTVLEYSATPLLDVQSDPTLSYSFEGLYSVTIQGFQHQDSTPYRCLDSAAENAQPLATVLHLNCSQPNCAVNGLSVSGAGYQSGPAVRVIRGKGTSATLITDPSHGPEGADGVVDALGTPTGSFVGITGSGLQLVGEATAIQFGVSGEMQPRLRVTADGALHYISASGDSGPAIETVVKTQRSNVTTWDAPPLAPGKAAKVDVRLYGAKRGDIASASLAAIDDEFVQLSAHARDGAVVVVLRNAASSGEPIDLGPGVLRVAVAVFA